MVRLVFSMIWRSRLFLGLLSQYATFSRCFLFEGFSLIVAPVSSLILPHTRAAAPCCLYDPPFSSGLPWIPHSFSRLRFSIPALFELWHRGCAVFPLGVRLLCYCLLFFYRDFWRVSRLTIITCCCLRSRGPISMRSGTPLSSHWLNFQLACILPVIKDYGNAFSFREGRSPSSCSYWRWIRSFDWNWTMTTELARLWGAEQDLCRPHEPLWVLLWVVL